MKRVFIIVLDSFGIGALPDAANYGDQGSDTLAACFASGKLFVPQMQRLGLFNIQGVQVGQPCQSPAGAFGRMAERSAGKDTTTGHWELMGLVSEKPMPTYPDGFPQRIIEQLTQRTGRGVLCNRPYSGTQVIHDYGEQHLQTGDLIVYTSADSVFQIAAHEQKIPLEQMYEYCRIARSIMQGEDAVGRIIARPFVGADAEHFTRRRTPCSTACKRQVCKPSEWEKSRIYLPAKASAKRLSPTPTMKGCSGRWSCATAILRACALSTWWNLICCTVTATTRSVTHRRSAALIASLSSCWDCCARRTCCSSPPTTAATRSTDHSREYVPLLCCGKSVRAGVDLATRSCFADLAATVGEYFDPAFPGKLQAGSSFLQQILK